MTDTILALIPDYGVWIVFFVVIMACLAIPTPASLLVIASGSFAASGDLLLWQAIAIAFAAYVLGDQIAYFIARFFGPDFLSRFEKSKKMAGLINRARAMLAKYGALAVFLTRTIISPLGPYMSYLCGAAGLKWIVFTPAAFIGAAFWATGYTMAGYFFADRLSDLVNMLSDGVGFVLAGCLALGSAIWLWRGLIKYRKTAQSSLPEADSFEESKAELEVPLPDNSGL